jgi:hypothetical protein
MAGSARPAEPCGASIAPGAWSLHPSAGMVPTCAVFHCERDDVFLRGHEAATLTDVARRLAGVVGCEFAGRWDGRRRYPGGVFVFAVDPLVTAQAAVLGVTSPGDLFGSVVPEPIVATKAISHALVEPDAVRPEGWWPAFTARVRHVVLPGYTAFSRRDVRLAAARLLAGGPVRAKDPREAGSRGQVVLETRRDVDKLLDGSDDATLARHGLVLERNLARVESRSVGQVMVGDLVVSYHGVQRETTANDGSRAYGGSDLVCVRGGWGALERLAVAPAVRRAIAQARTYDAAASLFPGFLATRRNYDVGQGRDAQGRRYSGVFEASWRPGGASGAEVAALEMFTADGSLERVEASTVERHGERDVPPPGARVHFHGVDPVSGPALRYTLVTAIRRAA